MRVPVGVGLCHGLGVRLGLGVRVGVGVGVAVDVDVDVGDATTWLGEISPHHVPQVLPVLAYSWIVHRSMSLTGSTATLL